MRSTNHYMVLYFVNPSCFNYTFLFPGSDDKLSLILPLPPPIQLAQSLFHFLFIYHDTAGISMGSSVHLLVMY